jgi:hypothetical protein
MIVKKCRIQKTGTHIIKSVRKKKTVRERDRCSGGYCARFGKVCKGYNYMYQTKYSPEFPRPKYYCHIISSGLYCRSRVYHN